MDNYVITNCRFLLGGRSSSAQERLPEGAHEFPFEFSLPPSPNLPTSFEVRSNIIILFDQHLS